MNPCTCCFAWVRLTTIQFCRNHSSGEHSSHTLHASFSIVSISLVCLLAPPEILRFATNCWAVLSIPKLIMTWPWCLSSEGTKENCTRFNQHLCGLFSNTIIRSLTIVEASHWMWLLQLFSWYWKYAWFVVSRKLPTKNFTLCASIRLYTSRRE